MPFLGLNTVIVHNCMITHAAESIVLSVILGSIVKKWEYGRGSMMNKPSRDSIQSAVQGLMRFTS